MKTHDLISRFCPVGKKYRVGIVLDLSDLCCCIDETSKLQVVVHITDILIIDNSLFVLLATTTTEITSKFDFSVVFRLFITTINTVHLMCCRICGVNLTGHSHMHEFVVRDSNKVKRVEI
jgi:hypothetical protein